MHNKNWKLLIVQFIAVIAIVAADQLTKLWIVNNVAYGHSFSVINGLFGIHHVTNTGAGWSILSGQRFVLIALPAVAIIAMIYALCSKKFRSKTGTWSVAVILAGAIGNLIDRIFRGGKVVDMFEFEFVDFPVFNVADIAITIGAILFFIYILFFYEDKAEKKDGKDLPDGGNER